MKIGEKSFNTRRPSNLDEQLIAINGLSAGEMATMLASNPLASHVAQALTPFLPEKDRPTVHELAVVVAEIGVGEAAAAVLKLYAEEAPAPATLPGAAA